jgi:hypothetical protein
MHIRALVPSKYCPNSFARMALLRWSVSSATASVRFFASSTRLYDIKAQDPRSSLRASDLYGPLSGAALRLSAAFGMLFRHYAQPKKLYIIEALSAVWDHQRPGKKGFDFGRQQPARDPRRGANHHYGFGWLARPRGLR